MTTKNTGVGYSPQNGVVLSKLSFRVVLHSKNHLGHISDISDMAKKLGYEYFVWNDRVYHLLDNKQVDTGLTFDDVM